MKKQIHKLNVISALYAALFLLISAVAYSADSSQVTDSKVFVLAAGDVLSIKVFEEPDLSLEATLGEDGVIAYPFLGDIQAKGQTVKQLQEFITNGLKGAYLVDPEVTVSVSQYRPFFINGEVANSGGYPYQPKLTVRKAIALAGGVTDQASLEKITIVRENDSNKKPKKANMDTKVYAGDIITIQEYSPVFINGEVNRPGGYPYQQGLTLRKAIALAGGFTPRANEDGIKVIREEGSNKESAPINLEDMVKPGDIITVNQSFF